MAPKPYKPSYPPTTSKPKSMTLEILFDDQTHQPRTSTINTTDPLLDKLFGGGWEGAEGLRDYIVTTKGKHVLWKDTAESLGLQDKDQVKVFKMPQKLIEFFCPNNGKADKDDEDEGERIKREIRMRSGRLKIMETLIVCEGENMFVDCRMDAG